MTLFKFQLDPVEDITPWGEPGELRLSWFALTSGRFHMPVGDATLFQYTDEIVSYWGSRSSSANYADYQVASFARDVLACFAAAVATLPPEIESLASRWDVLSRLRSKRAQRYSGIPSTVLRDLDVQRSESEESLEYPAWRWLGERSPWTGYFVQCPRFHFIRIGDEMRIHWDNRDRHIDGIPVWTARHGVHVLPIATFINECHDFASSLIDVMDNRLGEIQSGMAKPQVDVDLEVLRQEQQQWRQELDGYFTTYEPDIPWPEAVQALSVLSSSS